MIDQKQSEVTQKSKGVRQKVQNEGLGEGEGMKQALVVFDSPNNLSCGAHLDCMVQSTCVIRICYSFVII